MADIYEREHNWRQAAQVLVGIPLETGQKQYSVDYKLETYLKIARLCTYSSHVFRIPNFLFAIVFLRKKIVTSIR